MTTKAAIDWSYVAGYFDGEGHVGFHEVRRSKKGHMTHYLQWINTHRASIEAIREFLGTGRVRLKDKTPQPGRLPCYLLNVTGKPELLRVMEELIPRLLIKREACERMRDHLLNHVQDKHPGFGKAVALSAEQLSAWYHGEGKTFAEIGAIVGVTASSIARAFRLCGLVARKPGGRPGKPQGQHSEETKRKIREAIGRRWEDPAFREAQLDRLALGPKRKSKVGS